MNLDFNLVCRICLQEGKLKSIFKMKRKFESSKISCCEMIVACATVSIQENDGMPPKICRKCISKLKTAYSFRKLCEKSFKILTSLTTESGKLAGNIVKVEIPDSPIHNDFTDSLDAPLKSEDNKESDEVKVKDEIDKKEEFDENIAEVLTSLHQNNAIEILNHEDSYNDDYISLPSEDEKLCTLKEKKKSKTNNNYGEKKSSYIKVINKKDEETKNNLGVDVNMLKTKNGFQCHLCPRIIKTKRTFVRHLEKHLGIKSYFCTICQKCKI